MQGAVEALSARERLEAYLARKGWSQSDLARAAKLHSTTVSKLLSKDRKKRREPGLLVAGAIELVTADDPNGPILATSWLRAPKKPARRSSSRRIAA